MTPSTVASPTKNILYLFVSKLYSLLIVLFGCFMLCDYKVLSGIGVDAQWLVSSEGIFPVFSIGHLGL